MSALLHEFTSHTSGRNARVRIYQDRIEWVQERRLSLVKVSLGVCTCGLSLLATGVHRGKAVTEMIPARAVSSVTTRRDGVLNTVVSVIAAGNAIDFRVSHAEAETVRSTLASLAVSV